MGAATKAMVKLLGWADGERRTFLVVKWAQALMVGACAFELDKTTDHIDHVGAVEQVVDEVSWNHIYFGESAALISAETRDISALPASCDLRTAMTLPMSDTAAAPVLAMAAVTAALMSSSDIWAGK